MTERIAICIKIMALVDEYHEQPSQGTRQAIRSALMDEWAPLATPPQATLPASEARVTDMGWHPRDAHIAALAQPQAETELRAAAEAVWPMLDQTDPRTARLYAALRAQPQADAAAKPIDMTATGRKRIDAAAVALSEVMAFVKLDDDLAPKVSSALSGLCAMQANAPQADAAEPVARDTMLLDALRENSWDLRCIDIPTGQGDGDIHWIVVEHHMAAPVEREIGRCFTDEPRDAVEAAIAAQAPGARGEQA